MLLLLIYFLPCVVSLLWFFSFILKSKTPRQKLFCAAEGLSVVFYAILCCYFYPDKDYDTMVRMEVVCIPFCMLFAAYLVSYLYMHYAGRKLDARTFFWLIVPSVVLAVSIGQLCYLMGFDAAADVSRQFVSPEGLVGGYDTRLNHLYIFSTYYLFMAFSAAFLLFSLVLCLAILSSQGYRFGDVCRFFFKGRQTTRSRTIAVMYILELTVLAAMLASGSRFIIMHMWLGVALSIFLASAKHIIAYLEFYSDDDRPVTLYELSHLTLLAATPKPEPDQKPESEVQTITAAQIKMSKRLEHFRKLMEEDKVWQDENLTSQTLCEMMDIGKTTLSALVSQYYDMAFRDLVNQYRIDAAQRYMMDNPKATQETVAQYCGFKNAQYFNTQFKKVVGTTPAMWLASL